uniref:Uncharacterized protein n=1 Tax=viral metagenome TaxID=1070528 RepID=A0A6C0IW09_9ZZZZ
MNNILIFILIILILHLYINLNLIDNSDSNILYDDNDDNKNSQISEYNLENIDDYDMDAQNELLKYLDTEKNDVISDTSHLVNKSIDKDTIDKSFNNLNTDMYTFDEVPTHSNQTIEQLNKKDKINNVIGYYENDNQYYSVN